ncbi:MAG: PilZ domain-containing protein [Deltaproteobacteria bacterium]|jgi:hypothetical protein|nr:PilZ domain-containing protein [Deltaproteobacteria bacterium]
MLIDRRENPRFCVRDKAFAVFGPEPVKVAPIVDISLGGLGIGVNGINLRADGLEVPAKLEIVIDDGCFYLDKLPYQLLTRYRNFSGSAAGSFQNIYGVKFVDLMSSQQNRLKYFIRNHTRGGMTPKFIRKFNRHFHQIFGKRDFANSCQTAWLQRPSL